jgi:3-oxoacyl-[acyl-carrier-protein] synthase-1
MSDTDRTPDRTVHIVAVGSRTSVGDSAAASAAAVRARVTMMAEHPAMVDRFGAPIVVARAPYLPAQSALPERIRLLGGAAAAEAMQPHIDTLTRHGVRPAIIVGTPAIRPGWEPASDAPLRAELLRLLPAADAAGSLRALPLGHVGAIVALEQAWRLIHGGRAEACLAGGVDSYIDRVTLEWIDWTGQLHAKANPRGFIPGEAAGFCLLMSADAMRRCGLASLGVVVFAATADEQKLRRDKAICIGEGLTGAIRRCLAALPEPEGKVDHLIYDFNGQPHRAEEYGFTAMRVGGRLRDPGDVLAPADCWGDVGAASGALFASLAVAAAQRGYARGALTLLWASAMLAERSAALLFCPPRQQGGAP